MWINHVTQFCVARPQGHREKLLFCLTLSINGKQIIPWTVNSVEFRISFEQLFLNLRAGSIPMFECYAPKLQLCELSQCGVSKEREAVINLADKFLRVDEVCSQFGTYVCETSVHNKSA